MKNLFFIAILFMGVEVLGQQDPLYSQYMQNPLLINPAYTGTYNMFSTTAMHRRQWVGMQDAPTTNTITAHTSFMNNKLGGGIILVNDAYGINSNTEAHGTLAYKLRLSDSEDEVLSFGMQVGMLNYVFDNSKLNRKDELDPYFASGRTSITKPNIGAGIFYRSNNVFAGIAAPKMLNNRFEEQGSAGLQYRRHLFLTGGCLFDLVNVQLKPSVLLRYVEGAPVSLDVNGTVILRDIIWLGASARNLNSAVVMAQVQLSDIFRVGYSIDFPMNRMLRVNYGSHEVMLNMDLKLLKSHDIGFRYF